MNPSAPLRILSALAALALSAPAAVVTTADNSSPADDGLTSFLEALQSLEDGETISFNIPGDGPHYIVTPPGGYPLIERRNVTIDGYTQPGSSPNTNPLREPNNASIRIVLDSRAGGRRVVDYPGFGTTESAVLALLDATGFQIRGIAFLGVPGEGFEDDPSVYHIALIKGSSGARIQGCWFGLDPAAAPFAPDAAGVRPGIHGARSAIASFSWDGEFHSGGLLIGTDSDGNGDNGEFNLFVEQRLAIHLQTPDTTVAGNWFNLLPSGEIFDHVRQGTDLGGDGTLEAIENGDGTNMRIGTDGDGVNDANEGNFFGPVRYDVFIEFWRAAPNAVIAGNHFGVGLDDEPAFTLEETVSLLAVRADSSVRIGSDLNGTGDADEGNRIHGITGPFISFHNNNAGNPDGSARISLRGNDLTGNYGTIPLSSESNVTPYDLYGAFLVDPDAGATPVLAVDQPATTIRGTIPASFPSTLQGNPVIDFYLADGPTLFPDDPFHPDGFPQGRKLLASFEVDGPQDADPAPHQFSFPIPDTGLPESLWRERVIATANYRLLTGETVTTPFSSPATRGAKPLRLTLDTPAVSGQSAILNWSGGFAPWAVLEADSPSGPWTTATVTATPTATIPATTTRRFYRLRENALPAVQ